ncbi:asparaginyl-tRNA synthetase-like isoform X2 [Ornithodoros turicata]|uniref:asparaginyl-tRNA synthetase-like isoform X2 n=1 Tax=Ornithodoros turicata TaxID=34597 RepID=UPI0031399426
MLVSRSFFCIRQVVDCLKNSKRLISKSCTPGTESVSQLISSRKVNRNVEIKGWVKALRKHKDVVFFDVVDGSSAAKVQVVHPASAAQPELSYGCSVKVTGEVIPSRSKGQDVEIQADDVIVLGSCNVEKFPFRPRKSYPIEHVRQYFHLRPRLSKYAALLRIRNTSAMAVHSAFQESGFYNVHTPIITSNDCEGGGDVFTVSPLRPLGTAPRTTPDGMEKGSDNRHFFGDPAFLTVSAQLHLEALAMSLSKVYTFSPTFRAENCNTRRHLCEFQMVEAEEAFIDTLEPLLHMTEKLVKSSYKSIIDASPEDIHLVCKDEAPNYVDSIAKAMDKPFHRLTYDECVDFLSDQASTLTSPIKWGEDFKAEHEQFIVSYCGNQPVFVTHYPASIKPFYMKRDSTGRRHVADFLSATRGQSVPWMNNTRVDSTNTA